MSFRILCFLGLCWIFTLNACEQKQNPDSSDTSNAEKPSPSITSPTLIILGTIQDAGSPQIGCTKSCCKDLWNHPDPDRKVVSLGVIDPENKKNYIFEATPDFPAQMHLLKKYSTFAEKEIPDGIFLTHGHIGHYTGLMYLGKEAINANSVPVYAMPRMKSFLEQNGPWSQLVKMQNITMHGLKADSAISLSSNISVTPILVPHRDEFSETVGYIIAGPNKKALFIPDIDKWEKWEQDIIQMIAQIDYAFLDATFYDGAEINNRDISEIPHPFIIESIAKFKNLPETEKNKIHFIHFNHTNPALNPESTQTKEIQQNGFHIARLKDQFPL